MLPVYGRKEYGIIRCPSEPVTGTVRMWLRFRRPGDGYRCTVLSPTVSDKDSELEFDEMVLRIGLGKNGECE
jgi:hypothetical protein